MEADDVRRDPRLLLYVRSVSTPEPPDLHDYDWRMDTALNNHMFEAYCLTIITDLAVDDLIALLPSARVVDTCDHATLDDRGMDIFGDVGGGAGLVQVGGSVVMFEPNGYCGVTTDLMAPASVGRTVVSDYLGGHGVSTFQWYVDGQLRTQFEPPMADGREGTTPDDLVPLMRAIGGFPIDLDDPEDDRRFDLPYRQATLALMEALTGVRVTLELLRDSTFVSVDIPLPD